MLTITTTYATEASYTVWVYPGCLCPAFFVSVCSFVNGKMVKLQFCSLERMQTGYFLKATVSDVQQ